jgi:signal transduction histidine kinase
VHRPGSAGPPRSVHWSNPGPLCPRQPGTGCVWSPGGQRLSPKINRACSGWRRRPLLEAQRLTAEAVRAEELAKVDQVRAALVAAVGHDLRTPLAAIEAAVSSLRQPHLDLPNEAKAELLATIEEASDRLTNLVENLLSLSRLQAGALSVNSSPSLWTEPSPRQCSTPDHCPSRSRSTFQIICRQCGLMLASWNASLATW